MRALLKKDFLSMRSNLAVYVVSALIFAVVFFTTYGEKAVGLMLQSFSTVVVVMLPINALSSDEKSGWEVYSMSLPISRRVLIFSRYAFVYIVAFVCAVIGLLLTAGYTAWQGEKLTFEMLIQLMICPCVGLVLVNFELPMLLCFGVEKGRYLMAALWFGAAFLPMLLALRFDIDIKAAVRGLNAVNESIVLAVLLLGTAVITMVSMLISMAIYARKDIR